MGIFDKFDQAVDMKKIEEQKAKATENEYPEVPAGDYIARIESMEIALTKKDNRPMFKVQMRLIDGVNAKEVNYLSRFKNKKPCVFFNRVIFGNRTTDKWNDGAAIKSVETWVNKIFPDDPVVFTKYSEFAEDILDCAEACEGMEFEINYDPDRFNSISIVKVLN